MMRQQLHHVVLDAVASPAALPAALVVAPGDSDVPRASDPSRSTIAGIVLRTESGFRERLSIPSVTRKRANSG
jgi:hypothetical protein